MDRNILIIFLVLLAGWGFTAESSDVKPPASIQFTRAQQILTLADEARDRDDFAEAMRLYQESSISYNTLAANYPNWQPGITQFRVAYCNNQIDAIRKKMDEKIHIKPATNKPVDPLLNIEPQAVKKPEKVIIEAKLLIEKGDTEKARSVLIDGLKSEPDDRTMRMLMGIVHCRANEFENAMYLTETLLQEEPSNSTIRVILGTAYFGLNRTPDAIKQLQEALIINPKLAEAHYNLAQVFLSTRPADTAKARNHYKSALELGSKPDTKMNHLLVEPAATGR